MATIIEVAKEAGVSPGAVSDILRGRFRYSYKPDTIEKVNSAAARLGYQANSAARMLREQKKTMIGLAVPLHEYGKQSLARLTAATHTALTREGFHPIQIESEQLIATQSHVPFPNIDLLAGILSADGRMEETIPDYYKVIRSKVPVVAMYPTREPDISFVSVDRHRILEVAVAHLAELGHKRIAVVGNWASTYYSDQLKVESWPSVIEKFNLEHHPGYELEVSALPQEQYRAVTTGIVEAMLRLNPRPTALVCMNGIVGMGVLSALATAGVRVPQEISVVAYDYEADRYGSILYPPLTSLSRPVKAIAEAACAHLVRLIRDAPEENLLSPMQLMLDPILTVRESTAPPPR